MNPSAFHLISFPYSRIRDLELRACTNTLTHAHTHTFIPQFTCSSLTNQGKKREKKATTVGCESLETEQEKPRLMLLFFNLTILSLFFETQLLFFFFFWMSSYLCCGSSNKIHPCWASAPAASVFACRGVPWWKPVSSRLQDGNFQMGLGEHSHADYLSPEIPGHLKLVLSEFLEIGKLEISRRTPVAIFACHITALLAEWW